MAVLKKKNYNYKNNIYFLEYDLIEQNVIKDNNYLKNYSCQNILHKSFIKFLQNKKYIKNDKYFESIYSNEIKNELIIELIDDFNDISELNSLKLNFLEKQKQIISYKLNEFRSVTEEEVLKKLEDEDHNLEKFNNKEKINNDDFTNFEEDMEQDQIINTTKIITLNNFNKEDFIEKVLEYN